MQIFTDLFHRVDNITAEFITDVGSRSVEMITPIVSSGLTLSFIIYGWLIMKGAVEMPIIDFFSKSVRIVIITSIALTSGLYQTQIASAVRQTPDELINTLVHSSAKTSSAAAAIDQAAKTGFHLAGEAFDHAGFFVDHGFTYAFFGAVIFFTTGFFVAMGGTSLLMAKLMLALLVSLGPLFIAALLWQTTARFFDLWMAQIVNYILLAVLTTILFGLMLSIYSDYLSQIAFDGEQNVIQAFGEVMALSAVMMAILLQVPSLAYALAGGTSLSYLPELRTVKGTLGSTLGILGSTVGALKSGAMFGYRRISSRLGANKSVQPMAMVRRGSSLGPPTPKPVRGYYRGKR